MSSFPNNPDSLTKLPNLEKRVLECSNKDCECVNSLPDLGCFNSHHPGLPWASKDRISLSSAKANRSPGRRISVVQWVSEVWRSYDQSAFPGAPCSQLAKHAILLVPHSAWSQSSSTCQALQIQSPDLGMSNHMKCRGELTATENTRQDSPEHGLGCPSEVFPGTHNVYITG